MRAALVRGAVVIGPGGPGIPGQGPLRSCCFCGAPVGADVAAAWPVAALRALGGAEVDDD